MLAAKLLTGVVALQHLGFLVLEMFLWTHPIGLKVFRQTAVNAEISKALAANQGLYNGFLAAGLIWALVHPTPEFAQQVAMFFLACVVVAGLYGGWSVSWRITMIQAGPALIALALLMMGKN